MSGPTFGAPPAVIMCSIEAASRYRIPASLVLAVATVEGGLPGERRTNADGSTDIGPLQFNSTYIRSLARYGIEEQHVAGDGCYPFQLAAWRLRQHLVADKGDFWTRAANYHSRTPRFNEAYRHKLEIAAAAWSTWLAHHKDAALPNARAPTTPTTLPRTPAHSPRLITVTGR